MKLIEAFRRSGPKLVPSGPEKRLSFKGKTAEIFVKKIRDELGKEW